PGPRAGRGACAFARPFAGVDGIRAALRPRAVGCRAAPAGTSFPQFAGESPTTCGIGQAAPRRLDAGATRGRCARRHTYNSFVVQPRTNVAWLLRSASRRSRGLVPYGRSFATLTNNRC